MSSETKTSHTACFSAPSFSCNLQAGSWHPSPLKSLLHSDRRRSKEGLVWPWLCRLGLLSLLPHPGSASQSVITPVFPTRGYWPHSAGGSPCLYELWAVSQRKDFPFAPQVWSKGMTDFLHLDPSHTLSSHLAPIIPMRVEEGRSLYIGGVSQWDAWAFTSGPFMHIWYALSSWRHKTETGLGLLACCGHCFHKISRVSKQHQGGKNKEACNHSSHTHTHTHGETIESTWS